MVCPIQNNSPVGKYSINWETYQMTDEEQMITATMQQAENII